MTTTSPTLTPEGIQLARSEKKRYVQLLLAILLFNIIGLFLNVNAGFAPDLAGGGAVGQLLGVVWMGLTVWMFILIWRLGRSLAMGVPAIIGTMIVSFFWWFVGAFILLRLYRLRTGVGLTFLLGDRD